MGNKGVLRSLVLVAFIEEYLCPLDFKLKVGVLDEPHEQGLVATELYDSPVDVLGVEGVDVGDLVVELGLDYPHEI